MNMIRRWPIYLCTTVRIFYKLVMPLRELISKSPIFTKQMLLERRQIVVEAISDPNIAPDSRASMEEWGELTCVNVPLFFGDEPTRYPRAHRDAARTRLLAGGDRADPLCRRAGRRGHPATPACTRTSKTCTWATCGHSVRH